MQALYHPVGLGVVGRCLVKRCPQRFRHLAPEGGDELGAPIRDEDLWNSETGDPPQVERLGYCRCVGRAERKGFRPPREAVNGRQQVGVPVRRRQRPDQVHMDVSKIILPVPGADPAKGVCVDGLWPADSPDTAGPTWQHLF